MTPDGRYLVVRGRLWRRTRPDLDPAARDALVAALMDARRAVKAGKAAGNPDAVAQARRAVGHDEGGDALDAGRGLAGGADEASQASAELTRLAEQQRRLVNQFRV